MQELGQLLVLVTFFVTLFTALTAIAGALLRNHALMRSARYGLFAAVGLNVAMAIILTHGFVSHDFSNAYVASYSDRTMPVLYLIASFWGGEKGALLFWTCSLTIFSAIAIHTRRDREPVYLSWATGVLMLAIFFFFVLMVFESNPFETFVTQSAPSDGKGLNPLLQNPTMAFHPPAMLTGYICFTIPFAFGMAALLTGKLDTQWITDSRTWTIVSWCFLSIGLVLGALWAYQELGWGFYWMWDPVENAGLIPWFTGTAYLHSVMIQERRGMLRRWNIVLVCLTFFLTIFGTFLTRSQLIDSIHAFADSTVAPYFIGYMIVLMALSIGLVAWRWKALRSDQHIESLWSRESAFVMNNVFLVGSAFIVLWGTLFPKVSELPSVQSAYNQVAGAWNASVGAVAGPMETLDQAVTLGEPWFNRVMTPIGLVLLLLMGIGMVIPWRRLTLRSFRRNFWNPLTGSIVATVLGTTVLGALAVSDVARRHGVPFGEAYGIWADRLDVSHVYTVFAWLFCLFSGWIIAREFHEGTRVRRAKSGGGYVSNLVALTFRNPRRYGGYVIHFGIVLMFVAFTGKVFKTQDPEKPMSLGDELEAAGYHLTYTESVQRWDEAEGFALTRATMTVLDEGETVASREVDDLLAWLATKEPGVHHVETRASSPKMTVRFQDAAARDRIRDDFWLARTFLRDFVQVGVDEANARQTWRIRDTGLLQVVPMLAMQKIREAKSALGPGSTVGATVHAQGGSAQFEIAFTDAEDMHAFGSRLASLAVPPDLAFGAYDADTGALQFIDRRTGTALHPEVRFFAKHETPTTETAITSNLFEDLYVAMRPAMGQAFINLLTVVFPLVSFLWAGAIVLLLGTLFCLTPPWLARTVIALARGRSRRGEEDGPPGPPEHEVSSRLPAGAVSIVVFLVAAGLALVPSPARADLPEPRGFAPPPEGAAVPDVQSVLTCPCVDPSDEGGAGLSLASPACACERAKTDRSLVAELMAEEPPAWQASGRAKLEVLGRLVEIDPAWDARIVFDRQVYEHLLTTTKTTCSGERGLVLSQAQISCSVRNLWFPRFRRMLAAGMDEHEVFRFYVDECNATMDPTVPWTYEDLKANPSKTLSWAFPAALMVALVLGLLAFALRRNRRAPAPASSDETPELTPSQRLLLEDELDLLDG